MVVVPIAGVNEEEGESMSSWRQCCRKEERCCPEDQPRYGVLSEGLWSIVCSNPNGGHQVPWPWLGCQWAQMGRRVVLISLLILIPWKVETWFLAYKRRPAVYQCNISIPKIQRNNITAEQFKDMQMITKIPLLWMRMNEKEWIRNRYNAWVSSFYHLHSSSSAFPSSSSFFICHLPLSRRSPAALQPLFQTPLFCFEKRARLDSNRGPTVPKLRVLVQCAHQHQNTRHERPAVHSSPQTRTTTPIFFFSIFVILSSVVNVVLKRIPDKLPLLYSRW